jgi:hypothetical protein
MSNQAPEPIVLPPERLDRRPLPHVPNPDRLVLTDGEDELVSRMEERDADVVEVASAGVDLPSLRVGHTPKLDLAVIGARDEERKGRVE